jgi:hypothetical protein
MPKAMVSRTSDWRDELGRWLKPFLDRLGHKARQQMCPLSPAQAKFGRRPPHRKILTVVLAQHHPQCKLDYEIIRRTARTYSAVTSATSAVSAATAFIIPSSVIACCAPRLC